METGWVVYNRFAKQLFEYPAFAQIVDYEPFDIQDKKGTIFKTDPTIEYFIEREDAKVVFLRYRKTTEELEQSVILTEVKNAYKDVAGLYETDSLINNRPAFEKEVEALPEGASQYPWLYVYQHTVVRETQRCAASCH